MRMDVRANLHNRMPCQRMTQVAMEGNLGNSGSVDVNGGINGTGGFEAALREATQQQIPMGIDNRGNAGMDNVMQELPAPQAQFFQGGFQGHNNGSG